MNTGFDLFSRAEIVPYVVTTSTSGFDHYSRTELVPAIYYIAPAAASSGSVNSMTAISVPISIGIG